VIKAMDSQQWVRRVFDSCWDICKLPLASGRESC